jgi:hypothetical protein
MQYTARYKADNYTLAVSFKPTDDDHVRRQSALFIGKSKIGRRLDFRSLTELSIYNGRVQYGASFPRQLVEYCYYSRFEDGEYTALRYTAVDDDGAFQWLVIPDAKHYTSIISLIPDAYDMMHDDGEGLNVPTPTVIPENRGYHGYEKQPD